MSPVCIQPEHCAAVQISRLDILLWPTSLLMKAIWMGKLLKLAGYESGRDVHKMELCIDLCLDIYLLNYIKNYIFDT